MDEQKNYITLVGSIAESGKDDTRRLTVYLSRVWVSCSACGAPSRPAYISAVMSDGRYICQIL